MICTIKYFIFILFEATKSGAKFMQQTFTVQFIFQPHCGTDAIKNEASINILFNLIFILSAATKSGTSKIYRLMQQTFSVHWG